MNNTQHSAARAPGHEHIPIYPQGFIAVRIIQLILAVLIMGLSAYSVYLLAYDGNSFILAVAIMTLISSIYHLVAKYGAPYIYNYWAVLGLDIFFIVMWLSAFALQASRVAPLFAYLSPSYSSYDSSYISGYDSSYDTGYYYTYTVYGISWLGAQAGASALGGIQFILHIVALIIHSIRLHRHRAAGLHCMPGMPRTLPNPVTAGPATGGFVAAEKSAYELQQQQQQQQPPIYQHQTAPAFNPQHQPQQQGGYPGQGQSFYAPQSPQSPPPPQQLVAQQTGGSSYVSTPVKMPPQLPGN
ncbi:MARVEL domain-containing protein [Madurella fahalii]|uniref:MARVEL domain-containing protein n=1 Tax=Madurella fahalii TaxID=1157608 RepID=A0ABQ0FZY3_9PEZI